MIEGFIYIIIIHPETPNIIPVFFIIKVNRDEFKGKMTCENSVKQSILFHRIFSYLYFVQKGDFFFTLTPSIILLPFCLIIYLLIGKHTKKKSALSVLGKVSKKRKKEWNFPFNDIAFYYDKKGPL